MKSQTIFRRNGQRTNFTMVDNEFLYTKELTYKAKCIMIYLLSKPSDWDVRMCDVENHGAEGREAIRSGVRELLDAGYLTKEDLRENGQFGVLYRVHETPSTGNRLREPVTGLPSTGTRPQVILSNKTENQDITSSSSTKSSVPEKASDSGEPSKSTPTVHQQLIEWWCAQWKLKYRKTYTFKGVDAKKIKEVRESNKDDFANSRKTLASYLSDSSPWLADKLHALKHLEVNKYKPIEDPQTPGSAAPLSPAGPKFY